MRSCESQPGEKRPQGSVLGSDRGKGSTRGSRNLVASSLARQGHGPTKAPASKSTSGTSSTCATGVHPGQPPAHEVPVAPAPGAQRHEATSALATGPRWACVRARSGNAAPSCRRQRNHHRQPDGSKQRR